HHLRVDVAGGGDGPRKVGLAAQHDAGGLQPVLDERGLQIFHGRALHANIGVAPVVLGPAVAHPLAAGAPAAPEARATIPDEDSPVVAVAVAAEDVLGERTEPRDVTP